MPLKATLRSTLPGPLKVRVALDIPASVERLGGELVRELTLKPGEETELSWDLFISREEALAMYYSAKPAGFRVGLGPEVHKYADVAYPAIKVEVLDHTPVRFEEKTDADWQTGVSFRSIVPLRLMPLESRPPQVGAVSKEPMELVVWNRLGREITGTLKVANVDSTLRPIADLPVRVGIGREPDGACQRGIGGAGDVARSGEYAGDDGG